MKSDFPPPDYRNTAYGNEYLRRIIEEIRSENDADRIIAQMKIIKPERRERDPGEEG